MWRRVALRKTRAELLLADAGGPSHGGGAPAEGEGSDCNGTGGGLVRSLRTIDLLAIGVGSTVGTGVFSITGQVARTQAGPAVFICWLVGGVGCLMSGLGYIELAARLPVTGSVYAYAYHALGEVFAVVGAACITLEYGISASAVAANWGDKFKALVSALGAPKLAQHLSVNLGPVTLSAPALLVLLVVTAIISAGGTIGKNFARSSSALAVVLILLIAAAVFAAAALVALAVLGVWSCRAKQEVAAQGDDGEVFFQMPLVPWLPAIAIVFNNVMIASLAFRDFCLLAGYLAAVVVPYLLITSCRQRREAAVAREVQLSSS